MALILKHQTAGEFVARLREAYRNSSAEVCVRLGDFILARTQGGDITDAACRTAFGMSAAQWNILKATMRQRVDARNAVAGATGE